MIDPKFSHFKAVPSFLERQYSTPPLNSVGSLKERSVFSRTGWRLLAVTDGLSRRRSGVKPSGPAALCFFMSSRIASISTSVRHGTHIKLARSNLVGTERLRDIEDQTRVHHPQHSALASGEVARHPCRSNTAGRGLAEPRRAALAVGKARLIAWYRLAGFLRWHNVT